ncbi:uncharacterized protein LOC115962066 [Quercus lobata]|uniref:uncharacterized protein LOC115962066 n=1 Tax=Quercus lobata TaxID=97700 RepID=UPI001244C0DF|nr:uncharacterized protein LOC115962066 [Quercus lobata]
MYPDLYKGLNLKPENLTVYDSPLGSSWATWSYTAELNSTPTRLRQSTICDHLRIPKRSRSLQNDRYHKLVHFRSANRCRPFFQFLNKWKGFKWTEKCVLAFQQLKEYLSQPPMMSRLEVDEVLFAYIAVASYAVSLVLIQVDNGIQRPVYYVSKSLHKAEVRYLPLERAILSVNYTGRIAKWGMILEAFDIKYMPRTSVTGGVLNPLSSPWPFAQWGLDIVGPFLKAVKNKRYLLVGTDYFTKWVEAELLANIKDMDAKRFVWKNIVTQFGIPHTLISNNGLQFDSKAFRRYCCDLGIKNRYSTPTYPQGNGQVEAVNKVIVSGLKNRLDDAKEKWVEELPHVLLTYRTTPRKSIGETPFSMTYGAEVVIPLETRFPTLRTNSFTLSINDGLLEKSLDLIEKRRENAMVQLAYYQHKLK